MKNERVARLTLVLGAPALALVAAFLITSLVLVLAGDSVSGVWGQILSLPSSRGVVNIVNLGDDVLHLGGGGGHRLPHQPVQHRR